MKIRTAFTVLLLALPFIAQGQVNDHEPKVFDFTQAVEKRRTANSKDILSNFMQAALDNILGKDKTFTLSTTWYAIDSILNPGNGKVTRDEYMRQRIARHTQINLSVTAGEDYSITKFSGGMTIALKNNKNITYADFGPALNALVDEHRKLKIKVNNLILEYFATDSVVKNMSGDEQDKLLDEILASWEFAKDKKLHPVLNAALNKLTEDERDFLVSKRFVNAYNDLVTEYSKKGLLSFTTKAEWDRDEEQNNFTIGLNYTKGIGDKTKERTSEIEASAYYYFRKDTLMEARNMDQRFFNVEAGINKVLVTDNDDNSLMELKAFAGYSWFRANVNKEGKEETFTLNSTLRIRINKTLWLPVTLSYDPEHQNFLGYFSLKANIGDLLSE